MSDQDIEYLEGKFPTLSGSAFAAARERAFASGRSVLQSDNGVIYEVFPDGTRKRVKEIEHPTPVTPGSKLRIK